MRWARVRRVRNDPTRLVLNIFTCIDTGAPTLPILHTSHRLISFPSLPREQTCPRTRTLYRTKNKNIKIYIYIPQPTSGPAAIFGPHSENRPLTRLDPGPPVRDPLAGIIYSRGYRGSPPARCWGFGVARRIPKSSQMLALDKARA